MKMLEVKEGYIPFGEYETYYRTVGLENSIKAPLIVLHGGPGSTHNYFEVLDDVVRRSGHPIIMYDQLGCGKSSMPDKPELWNMETWLEELRSVIAYFDLEEYHLLGQSWGGMLLLQYVCDDKPKALKSMVLSSTLPSSALWGQEQHRLIRFMSEEDQHAIKLAEQTGDYTTPEYQQANDRFMLRHAGDVPTSDSPEPLRRDKKVGRQAYETAWGPNEFTPLGTLKDFDCQEQLKEIPYPTLVISGINDLCTPIIAKKMVDEIPNATWELFEKSRHMPFVDEHDTYCRVLHNWLVTSK